MDQNKKESLQTKRITIKISEDLYEKSRLYCFKNKTTLTQEIKSRISSIDFDKIDSDL